MTTETETPEWLALVAREPYGIGVRVRLNGRASWKVYHRRTEKVVGTFRTRDAALARCNKLNGEPKP